MKKLFIFTYFLSIIQFHLSSVPKIIYFNAKGSAEISRVLFKVNGTIEFEDFRYKIKDFRDIKNEFNLSSPFSTITNISFEYSLDKGNNSFIRNFNRLPILVVNETQIGGSSVIERYIARKCNLMGISDEESALIDNISEHVREIKEKWAKIRLINGIGSNRNKEKAIYDWFEGGQFSMLLSKLENSLPQSIPKSWDKIHWSVGFRLSYADICIWHLLKDFFPQKDSWRVTQSEKRAKCTRLTSIANHVASLPQIKSWIERRPNTKF